MAQHGLQPSYVQIQYHSAYGQHKQTIPTRLWQPELGTHGFGGFEAWNTDNRDAEDMIDDLVALFVAIFPTTVHFDAWTIFNFDEDADFFIPVAGASFDAVAGTEDDPGWTQAVQSVFTFFDTGFNTVKLMFLDTASGNNFARRSAATAAAAETAIAAEFMSVVNAWSSRANLRPSVLRSVSLGINDALKKQYAGI